MSESLWTFKFNDSDSQALLTILNYVASELYLGSKSNTVEGLARRIAYAQVVSIRDELSDIIT